MKIERNLSETEIGGVTNTPVDFQIKASREAFQILSSGLYQDKILAIIRELSANAYDSHVEAGKVTTPFDIHLPTNFEPYFTIRDYGVGLSDPDVKELYTTYFSSNRSNSNSFVGAMGLGSKSPFCYTTGFTLISIFGGKKRSYSAFIGDQGTPQILLLSEEDATEGESTGLEVSFPVKSQDVWEWENKARIALEFFNPKPNLNFRLDIVKQNYVMKTDKWGLRRNPITHHTSTNRAIQGMVQYSVGNIDLSRMDSLERKLNKLPIDIFFEIGELSVAASRETLSNDDRTIKNVLAALNSIKTDMVAETKKKIAECQSYWQARILIFNLTNVDGLGHIVREAFESGELDGQYEHFNFSKEPIQLNELDYKHIALTQFHKTWRRTSIASKAQVFKLTDQELRTEAETNIGTKLWTKDSFNRDIDVGDDTMFVISDIPGTEKYIHYFLERMEGKLESWSDERKPIKNIYFITRFSKDEKNTDVIDEGLKIIQKLGNPPFMAISELKAKLDPLMEVEKKAKPVYQVRRYIKFNPNKDISRWVESHQGRYQRTGWGKAWDAAPAPSPGRKFYVEVERLVPTNEAFPYAEDFAKFLSAVRKSGEFDIDADDAIYGISKENMKLYGKHPDWVEFFGYVFSNIKTVLTPAKQLQLSLSFRPFNSNLNSYLLEIADKKILQPTSKMQEFAEMFKQAAKASGIRATNLVEVARIAQKAGVLNIEHLIDFDKLYYELTTHYPMLSVLDTGYSYRPFSIPDLIIEYCQLVDNKNINDKIILTGIPDDQPGDDGINKQEGSQQDIKQDTIN